MFGIFMGSQVPLRKICKNCNQEKRANSFFKSQRSRDGLSALCKSCRSISGERYDLVKYSFPELENFEDRSRKKAMGVRREIEKFRNEYRSGHWEPAVLCLGRVCEAQVFELAQRLNVQTEFPQIKYLEQLKYSHEKISEELRVLLTGLASREHQKKQLQRETKSLIEKTISFGYDIDAAIAGGIGDTAIQDSNFALNGIKKYVRRHGNDMQNSLFSREFEPCYREVVERRNIAAHAPRENAVRLLKKDIKLLYPRVAKLIEISSEFI